MAAAAKQQHQYNDNQDQFHGKSPTALWLFIAHRILVWCLKVTASSRYRSR
jgi:hypothetical protein